MPRAGFESTVVVFELSKNIRVLDRATTGIGQNVANSRYKTSL